MLLSFSAALIWGKLISLHPIFTSVFLDTSLGAGEVQTYRFFLCSWGKPSLMCAEHQQSHVISHLIVGLQTSSVGWTWRYFPDNVVRQGSHRRLLQDKVEPVHRRDCRDGAWRQICAFEAPTPEASSMSANSWYLVTVVDKTLMK